MSKTPCCCGLQGPRTGPAASLLILSNRIDPITPLENACKLSHHHPGSSVVVESVGHCALTRSKCIKDITREYFNTGKVPTNGTTRAAESKASIPKDSTIVFTPQLRLGWIWR